MAHIVDFEVAGLAGRKEVITKKLDNKLNVFFGLNGSGKTSLLRILHAAMENNASHLANVPFHFAKVTIYSVDYNKSFTVSLEKIATQRVLGTSVRKESTEAWYEINNEHAALGRINTDFQKVTTISIKHSPLLPPDSKGAWSHKYLPTWRLFGEGGPRRESREDDWDMVFARGLSSLWSMYSAQMLSEVQTVQTKGLLNILQGILVKKETIRKPKKLDTETAYNRVAAFLMRQGASKLLGSQNDFAVRYNKDSIFRKIVDDINRVEQKIEDAKIARNKLEELIKGMFSGNKKVEFSDTAIKIITDSGDNIGLNTLSAGEKQALKILIETMITGSRSTIIIDEPELSLHIDWQKLLISAMQQLNPSSQIILATHSPDIMADVPDENIFRL